MVACIKRSEQCRGTDGQLDGRSGCKDGAKRRGMPLYMYETASPHKGSCPIAALAHARWRHVQAKPCKAWCRCAAPGGYGAARRLEGRWSWEHGACGKGGAACGGIPCVRPRLSNRDGGGSREDAGPPRGSLAAKRWLPLGGTATKMHVLAIGKGLGEGGLSVTPGWSHEGA